MLWGTFISEMQKASVRLLFPSRCHLCGISTDNDAVICPACFAAVSFIDGPICTCCGSEFTPDVGKDHLCGNCIRKKPSFDKIIAVGRYQDPLKTILHRLKFAGDTSMLSIVKHCLECGKVTLPDDMDCIMPVPLHIHRLRKRGFNQSLLLARELFPNNSSVIQSNILQRCKNTDPQTSLSKKERHENLTGAFIVKTPEAVRGKRICLVDDIYTTGSTMEECSKTLMKTGASSVLGVVIARTPLW